MTRAVLAAAASLVLVVAGVSTTSTSDAVVSSDGRARIQAPEAIDAGTGFDVEVLVPSGVGAVQLSLLDAFGVTTLHGEAGGGSVSFRVPPVDTTVAGLMTLVAAGEGLTRTMAEVAVRPAGPAGPIVPLIGPRSIVADGADFTMVAVLPEDRFGNPLSDGTPLEVVRRLPDGQAQVETIRVDHHVARTRLVAGTRAGEDLVTVGADGVAGPERPFTEVAGLPVAFGLERDPTDPVQPEADGRTLVTVRTEVLIDRFANVVPDGTMVEFRLAGPDGQASLQGVTVGGRSAVWVQAPTRPGPLRVRAWVSDRPSAPLTIGFGAAVSTLPARARVVDGVLTVVVGPVLGRRGGFVADGTVVRLLARQADEGGPATGAAVVAEKRILVVDGRGEARLDAVDPDRPWRIELSSSGATATVTGP